MNYRINTKAVLFVVVLVLIAIGLFAYTLVSAPTDTPEDDTLNQAPRTQEEQQIISAKHQFRDGTHTIAGTVELPTACYTLVVEPFFTKPNEQVQLRFISAVKDTDGCADVTVQTPFTVTFDAPESVSISALWNGAPARLNLVPVAPGESIDDDLYFKG